MGKQQLEGIRQAKGWIQRSPQSKAVNGGWGATLTRSLPGVQRCGLASANLKDRAPEESLSTSWRTDIRSYLASEGRANEFKRVKVRSGKHLKCPLNASARVFLSPGCIVEASGEF